MERVGVNAARQDLSAGGNRLVVGARQTRYGIQENDYVALVFHQTLGLFQNHFGNVDVALGLLVKGRRNYFRLDRSLHLGDFLGAFVNQKDDKVNFGIVGGYRVGNLLHKRGLSGFWRSDNQKALALSDRAKEVYDAGGKLGGNRLKLELFVRIKGREVFKGNSCLRHARLVKVHALYAQQGKEALALLGASCLAVNRVARLKVEKPDLAGRNVNVVRTRKV